MRKTSIGFLLGALMFGVVQVEALAHPITKVASRSICRYEERYYVWTPGRPWKVVGRIAPEHAGVKVVLQRSKYGRTWREWRSTPPIRMALSASVGSLQTKAPGGG